MSKVGLIVSFYDEDDIVKKTIQSLKSYDNKSPVVCIHSHNPFCSEENIDFLKKNCCVFKTLENLGDKVHEYKLASESVCRNYSEGFRMFHKLNCDVEYTIAILGDTFIYDFSLLVAELDSIMLNKKAGVLQAVGQNFHSKDANPIENKFVWRYQHNDTTDFMPQLFVLKGITGFTSIENTNTWTTEENLGNELLKYISSYKEDVVRLNSPATHAYNFFCGVNLQVKGLGHTRW